MTNIYFVLNGYHTYCTCTETIFNTVYCFGKKSVIEDCFISFSLLWLILLEKTFWRRGSHYESVVNRNHLLRICIVFSTSFRDGGKMGSLETLFLLLLIFSTFLGSCGRYSLTVSSTDNDQDLLVAISLSRSTVPSASRFGLVSRKRFRSNSNSSTELPSSALPMIFFKWVIMIIHSTCTSFHLDSSLTEISRKNFFS